MMPLFIETPERKGREEVHQTAIDQMYLSTMWGGVIRQK